MSLPGAPQATPQARSGPGLLAAALAIPLLWLAATLPTGPPPDARGARAWDGLGPLLDARLPGEGWVIHARIAFVGGREHRVEHRARLGDEIVTCALYALWLPLGALALARQGGVPPLLPRRADLEALRAALAWLVPGYLVVGLGGALLAVRLGHADQVRAAVYGFSLPTLADPRTAAWPLLRLVLVGPLAEELLWRGLVFRGLRGGLPLAPATVVAALSFALWHWLTGWQALGALCAQYVGGFAACLLVERSGGLGGAFLLHALGNALVAVLYLVCMFRPEHLLGMLGG